MGGGVIQGEGEIEGLNLNQDVRQGFPCPMS